jgi:hypothetical protein
MRSMLPTLHRHNLNPSQESWRHPLHRKADVSLSLIEQALALINHLMEIRLHPMVHHVNLINRLTASQDLMNLLTVRLTILPPIKVIDIRDDLRRWLTWEQVIPGHQRRAPADIDRRKTQTLVRLQARHMVVQDHQRPRHLRHPLQDLSVLRCVDDEDVTAPAPIDMLVRHPTMAHRNKLYVWVTLTHHPRPGRPIWAFPVEKTDVS